MRPSSTTKISCGWQAIAKALASNGRKWTLEIRYHAYNYDPAEDVEDIATFRNVTVAINKVARRVQEWVAAQGVGYTLRRCGCRAPHANRPPAPCAGQP